MNASTEGYELNKWINRFLSRTDGNKVVFRHDNGESVSTTIDCLEIMGNGFGIKENSKGFKVFDSGIGLLWSDGLNYKVIRDIHFGMESNRWTAENIIFGMGGGLHTSVNRDTQRNAFKSLAQMRSGVWYDIFKKPLDSSKLSKSGRFKLIKEGGMFKTINIDEDGDDYLRTLFKDGNIIVDDNFDLIKKTS